MPLHFIQVDPQTLGLNLYLLIGGLILLVVGIAVMIGLVVAVRLWLAARREKDSWEEYQQQRLAPDGRPYPPFIEGVCQRCGRGDRHIYHPDSGEELCSICFEEHARAPSGEAIREAPDPAPDRGQR